MAFLLGGYHELTAALPPEHVVQVFSKRARLQAEAEAVRDSLCRNECHGNQWILVLGLSRATIDSLASDKRFLEGIDFRFQWEGYYWTDQNRLPIRCPRANKLRLHDFGK